MNRENGGRGLKEGGVYHHDPDPRRVLRHQEGEWRLGCPVEYHKQGVHSILMKIQIISLNNQHKENMMKKINFWSTKITSYTWGPLKNEVPLNE